MKNIIYCVFIGLVVVGCSKQDPTVTNKEIAAKMFEAFNAHDWNKMASCYKDGAAFLDPSIDIEYQTKTHKDIIDKYSAFQKMLPDVHDTIVKVYAVDDKVIVEFVATGTVPDGPKLKLPIISVLTIKDGVIVRDATYYDHQK